MASLLSCPVGQGSDKCPLRFKERGRGPPFHEGHVRDTLSEEHAR